VPALAQPERWALVIANDIFTSGLENEMASHPKSFYTPEEYLKLERKAAYKSEYYTGEIFAMSGGSRAHNLIVINVATGLNAQLENRECEVYASDMRVRTPDSSTYAYPDVVVVCGQPQFEDAEVDTLLNPTLIIEVLSPSTETHDRTKKFADYRKIESLKEYILIAQRECRVTQFIKQPDGMWLFQEAINLDESAHLPSVNCDLALEKVYRKVVLPSQQEEASP
jgi:Uma2 family endonuclease